MHKDQTKFDFNHPHGQDHARNRNPVHKKAALNRVPRFSDKRRLNPRMKAIR